MVVDGSVRLQCGFAQDPGKTGCAQAMKADKVLVMKTECDERLKESGKLQAFQG